MFITLLYLSLFGYQKAEFAVQEKFRVEYVMLDVKALDKDDNQVTDLKLSDFEIKENRKRVQPDFFEILDFRQDLMLDELPTDEAQAEQKIKKEVRQIIIALDLEWTETKAALRAFKQMEDFLKNLPQDVVYRINLYSIERGSISKGFVDTPQRVLAYLQEFQDRQFSSVDRTSPYGSDGSSLLSYGKARSDSIERYPAGRGSRISGEPHNLEALEDAFRECGSSYIGMRGRDDFYTQCIYTTLNDYNERMQNRARQVIGALEILTYKFEDNDDLKMILFVSPGFAYADLNTAQQLANLFVTGETFGTPGSMMKGKAYNMEDDFKRVLHACIKNRVIFNTVDIFNTNSGETRRFTQTASINRNIDTEASFLYTSYKAEIAEGVAELAEESGGRFFQTFHLTNPLQKVFDEDRFFYQIGYPSPSGKPGRFREIKIKCKRKGVKLYYRQGYYGGS